MLGQRKTRDGRPLDAAKAMRRPANKYAFATAFLSSATPLFLGYDLAVVYSTAVMAEADLKLLACVIVLSSILGAVTAVAAQRLIGDRRTVLLSAAVLCAGALARGLARRLAAFTAGVFVNGVGMGMALMIIPAYAGELGPSSVRGVLTSHPDGFVYLGCILGSLCYSSGFLKLQAIHAWRLIAASGTAVPALLSSAALLLPESPRCLVAMDMASEARRVLARTSATLEEAELRLLEINAELGAGAPHDGNTDEPAAMAAAARIWWREELRAWRELVARPTEPLRRAVVSAVVAKVFQQASGIGSMLQYVQRAFRDAGVSSGEQLPRALAALGFVVVVSFSMSLALVELGWLLVRALASGCARRAPWWHRGGAGAGAGGRAVMTRRQEQLKWARGLSATMLVSLMALVWLALGPAQWADASPSPRGCPRWLRAAAAAANEAVSSAILSSFAWVYQVTAAYGNLLLCPAAVVLVWMLFCACLLGAGGR
ncbi:hypothetical protein ACP4OV_018778 [Aristida adscensionis]